MEGYNKAVGSLHIRVVPLGVPADQARSEPPEAAGINAAAVSAVTDEAA